MKVARICVGNALKNGCIPNYDWKYYPGCSGFAPSVVKSYLSVYVFMDDLIMIPWDRGGMPIFIVDLNGKKAPNKVGYDIHIMKFQKNIINSYPDIVNDGSCLEKATGGKNIIDLIRK